MENLEHEQVNKCYGIECSVSPYVASLVTGLANGFGLKMPSNVLPKLLKNGKKAVLHQSASLHAGLVSQHPSCSEASFYSRAIRHWG